MEQRKKDKIIIFFNALRSILAIGIAWLSLFYFLEATLPVLFRHQHATVDSFFKLGVVICLECMLINDKLHDAQKKSN